jgi:hypothetical protein
MKMFKSFLLASALLVSTTVASNAAVLFSDNFDTNLQGLNSTPTGWGTVFGSVDIIGTPGAFPWYSSGNQVDMNGSTGVGGLIYTFSTWNFLAGKQYNISFDYGNNKNSNGVEQLFFGLTDLSTYLTEGVLNVSGAVPNLLHYSVTFTLLSNFTGSLGFQDGGSSQDDNGGVIIDNVVLSAVPLPAALPLLAAGLGVLGFAGRRRRAKAAV